MLNDRVPLESLRWLAWCAHKDGRKPIRSIDERIPVLPVNLQRAVPLRTERLENLDVEGFAQVDVHDAGFTRSSDGYALSVHLLGGRFDVVRMWCRCKKTPAETGADLVKLWCAILGLNQ